MPNTLLTSQVLANEFVAALHSSLRVVKNIDHSWNKLFGKSFGPVARSGATVSVGKPALGVVRESWTMGNDNSITEEKVDINIGVIRGVDIDLTDAELALSIDDFSQRIIQPNARSLAAQIDAYCAQYMVQNTYNAVGTPGTSPNSADIFLAANQLLNENLTPPGSRRVVVIEPQCERTIVNALSGQYNPQPYISKMFEKGSMPSSNALGLEWYMSQVVAAHTCGSRVATAGQTTVHASTPPSEGATSLVDAVATTGKTYKKGDVFTIAGVYNVNYETKASTGQLKQFVVTADATASNSKVTLNFAPAMYASGARKNISALPAAGAHLTFFGAADTAYKQELVFAPESYAIAFADLPLPRGVEASVASYEGISIRITSMYDIVNARLRTRLDSFFGIAALRPEWACRVFGA